MFTFYFSSKISYTTLDAQGYVKTILTASSLNGLTVHKDHIYWSDVNKNVIERANKADGFERSIILSHVSGIQDLKIVQKIDRESIDTDVDITNPCEIDNGGCPELCLFNGQRASCQCSSHQNLENFRCAGPENFLLFGQKNKISRLFIAENEVPDLVLPVQGLFMFCLHFSNR